MAKIFESVGMNRPRYSSFDLSREQKLSFKMGDLIPTYLEEILPGDQFRVKTETMLRLAPMLAPIMHRVDVFMHYFFVPNRLVWNQWEDFITGGQDGTTAPIFPTVTMVNEIRSSKLTDYLGLPTSGLNNSNMSVSALPYRAYQKIWNEYFRDETLNAPIDVHTATPAQLSVLQKRSWQKDYFTSALPFTQRGPEVGIPIQLEYKERTEIYQPSGVSPSQGQGLKTGNNPFNNQIVNDGNTEAYRIENLENTNLDFSINELRKSSALQRWLEKQARGGYRYIETILSHFGVKSSDARLQRPEYLGGGKQPVVISEVLNNTGTANAPQGDMAGHGISVGTTNHFSKTFEEHGYVFGILSVLPKTGYFQGVPRHWSRRDKTEYYWPEFANLGEQEIKNQELFYNAASQPANEETWGYQQRYAEYKYGISTVHGDFRNTLEFWHMARKFSSLPPLNGDFVKANPTTRIFAVEEGDTLWCQLYHDVKARRAMPFFADPKLS